MSIVVLCDICGKKIIELAANARWEIERYGERIVCEDCEEKYADFEDELQRLEKSSFEKLEEEKEALRKKFFNEETKSSSNVVTKEDKERDEEKREERPRFRTLRK